MSGDPSGFPDGVNSYAYAAIPGASFDPWGLWRVKITGKNSPSPATGNANGTSLKVYSTAFGPSVGYTGDSINATAQSDSVLGDLLNPEAAVNVYSQFEVTVDSSGHLSVTEKTASYSNFDGDLQGALQVSVSYSSDGKTATVNFTGGATWQGSGVNGAGFGVTGPSGAGVNASLSWTHGTGTTTTSGSFTFKAIE